MGTVYEFCAAPILATIELSLTRLAVELSFFFVLFLPHMSGEQDFFVLALSYLESVVKCPSVLLLIPINKCKEISYICDT